MSSHDQFYVEIVSMAGLEVFERMGPMSERKAERVEIGALINLDRDAYFVRVVPEREVGQ